MVTIRIQKVSTKNFDAFFGLTQELAEFEKLPGPDMSAKRRLKKDCFSKKPRFFAYLATVKHAPAGYVIFYFTYSNFLAKPTFFLEDLFVSERFRSRGIGKKLFSFCVRQAKKQNCGRLEFMVLNWNTKARRFYEKLGAKPQNWVLYRLNQPQIKQFK